MVRTAYRQKQLSYAWSALLTQRDSAGREGPVLELLTFCPPPVLKTNGLVAMAVSLRDSGWEEV